ncbi:MAG: malectin domain-containing carbohydrate-binding protein, partial [Chitinophagaceae bacterium]
NQAPVADAGADKLIILPANSTNLNGSGSDADGSISSYSWNQVSGPNTAVFTSKTVPTPTISSLTGGVYVFSLVVTDNLGVASAADRVSVTVNQAPVANAGSSQTITQPASSALLNGSGTDADGTVTAFSWLQVSGPNTAVFSSKIVAAPTVSALVSGIYVFSFVVTDNLGTSSAAVQVSVTVNTAANQAPVANAGPDKIITLPLNSTEVNGSGTDADGTIAGYTWSQVSGPSTAVISSVTAAAPTVSSLVAGSYVFSLVVRDNLGSVSAADIVTVTVNAGSNMAPVANAGPDKTITLPVNNTTLNGSGTDADGSVTGYSWSQVSGPNTATFTSTTVAVPTVSGLIAGNYAFNLVVTDNLGGFSLADQVIITVTAAGNTTVYRINAGGGQVTNSIGVFQADAFFSPTPGNFGTSTSPIGGTTDDNIYQSERYGGSGVINYNLPVSSGQYTVILHFAEYYFGAVGNRVFDVSLEGTRVLDNFDIVRKVGALNATTETFSVNVADGMLDIYFSSLAQDGGANNPKISAIEVIRTSASVASGTLPATNQSVTNKASGQNNPAVKRLSVKVQPNPSKTYFTLTVLSGTDKPVRLGIYDNVGRLVEVKSGVAVNSSFQVGANYLPGTYYAEVFQGKDKLTLKLIKQSQ